MPGYGTLYEVRSVIVTFDQPMDPSTFTAADLSFLGPAGVIPISGITVVNPADPRNFMITFAVQSQIGVYRLTIGPHISSQRSGLGGPISIFPSLYNRALEMDQDQDGITSEPRDDQFTLTFTLGDRWLRPWY